MFEPAGGSAVVETHPWVDSSDTSSLVANFARVHILVSLFDGDPAKWMRFIQRNGTPLERANDLPFIESLQNRLRTEPFLIEDLRRVIRDFSAMLP